MRERPLNNARDLKSGESVVVERGPHHKVWQRTVQETLRDGRVVTRHSSFTELATGMHYLENGQWVEAKEEIEIVNGSGIARKGQHTVHFAADLNTEGAIDLTMSDGQRLRSHVLGLAYYDAATGDSEMIAVVRNSTGQAAGNQVLYPDAFDGKFRADMRYTYTRLGLEQDVVIRTVPPSPEAFGMNPETTRLEVWTEFLAPPVPMKGSSVLKAEPDAKTRQQMVEPDLTDETLDFGPMRIGSGSAFPLEATTEEFEVKQSVGKLWRRIEGRDFLIERIDYQDIAPYLQRLPRTAALQNGGKNTQQAKSQNGSRQGLLALLKVPARAKGVGGDSMLLAKAFTPEPGFVLDYILASSATNFTFKGDRTYLVGGTFNLSGTTTFEGGAVIKCTNGNNVSRLMIQGLVDCRTGPYLPVTFTSLHDDTVGERIWSWSSGVPGNSTTQTGTNACGVYLDLTGNTNSLDFHDIRLRHAYYGFRMFSSNSLTISHSQMGSNYVCVYNLNGNLRFRNALLYDSSVGIALGGNTNNTVGENITALRLDRLRSSGFMSLTNSILAGVTNGCRWVGANVSSNWTETGLFQVAGNGSRYLANSSTNRDAGTTNINPSLLAAIRLRTTYPPSVLTNVTIPTNMVLTQTVGRDTNALDLGYHYDPLDWFVSGVTVASNVTLLATNDVAIGVDFSQSSWGFILDSARFLSVGGPLSRNRLTRAHTVQETTTGNPGYRSVFYDMSDWDVPPALCEARFRFTDYSQLADDGYFLFTGLAFRELEWTHSAMYNPALVIDVTGSGSLVCGMTNSLWLRGGVQIGVGGAAGAGMLSHLRNNLWKDISLHFIGGNTNWTVRDNVFHGLLTNLFDHGYKIQNSTNAFFNTVFTNLAGGTNFVAGVSNLILTNLTWSTGKLGDYYYDSSSPLSLIDAGSRRATNAGLYHFTTTANQSKEGVSIVDIGLHYLALNTNGLPFDTDGDGIPDYLEDKNGNGAVDPGETSYHDPVLTVAGTMDYIKGSPPKRMDTNATVVEPDCLNFGGGQLQVVLISGADASDRLGIRHEGNNAAQIGISSTNVTFGGTNIATFGGGLGGNALAINFNTNAVVSAVQALLRNITFNNSSNNPSTASRVAQFILTDGKGGTNRPTFMTIHVICPQGIDAMLVIDISYSLLTNEFAQAKQAASNFISHLEFTKDRVGLISFAGDAYLNSPLTTNAAAVQSAIQNLSLTNGTRFEPPLDLGRSNLTQTASNVLPLLLLLSDGRSGGPPAEGFFTNRVLATNAALAVKDAGIRLITIAYGTNSGENGGTNLMEWFASSPNDYYYAPTASDIASNYAAIAQGLCRGGPTVTITSPTNGTQFSAPANISIVASASAVDGTITKVEFYTNGVKLSESTSAPYTANWTNVHAGTNQSLTAVAWDNHELSTTSAVVLVTVHPTHPVISIVNPPDGTVFAAPGAVKLRAAVSDADGLVTNVAFYNGSTLLGSVTNPPFNLHWTNLAQGAYTVSAIARDDDGFTNQSAPITFLVTNCTDFAIHSISIIPSTVLSGNTATGIISLVTAAPKGGVSITLTINHSAIYVPPVVFVEEGATNTSFLVRTKPTSADATAEITASLPSGSASVDDVAIIGRGFSSSLFNNQCGPMDVVFILDTTGSMGEELDAVRTNVTQICNYLSQLTDGDFRLALLTFGDGDCGPEMSTEDQLNEHVFVNLPFTTNVLEFSNVVRELPLISGGIGFSGCPEAWDEALNTVINQLPGGSGRTNALGGWMQCGDFTEPFRENARKVILVITDDRPSGGDDMFENGVDDVNAHRMAVAAYSKNIQINTIYLESDCSSSSPHDKAYLADCSSVSGGVFQNLGTNYGSFAVALQRAFITCGADIGEVIYVRDDQRAGAHSSIVIDSSHCTTESPTPMSFDLFGIGGIVEKADLIREGILRVPYGSKFSWSPGVRSAPDSNLVSFALPLVDVATNALGSRYSAHWSLPFPFFTDLQAHLGRMQPVVLVDRAITACGNRLDAADIPQDSWPYSKNVIRLHVLAKFEIPQGRCREFVLSGTNAPVGDEWELWFQGDLIANSCNPRGWGIQVDNMSPNGTIICVPQDAIVARSYELRIVSGAGGRSAVFDVLPPGSQETAPVLKSVQVTPEVAFTNDRLALSITLDAPAPPLGAVVALRSSGLPGLSMPSFAVLQPGMTSTSISLTLPTILSNTSFQVTGNYNGEKRGAATILSDGTVATAISGLTASPLFGKHRLSWDSGPGIAAYTIHRSSSISGVPNPEDDIVIATGVSGSCFVDHPVFDGTNYCYRITASNRLGMEIESTWVCPILTSSETVRPLISPYGGRFNEQVQVTIVNFSPGKTVRYTIDGAEPTTSSPTYSTPFVLTNTSTVRAAAFDGGNRSSVAVADFLISKPQPIQCGDSINGVLRNTNGPSSVLGDGFYSSQFNFQGFRGDVVTLVMNSLEIDGILSLLDPNRELVAQGARYFGFQPFIQYTLQTNGSFYIEVSTRSPRQLGVFSLSLDCEQSPELEVTVSGISITNGETLELGITTNGVAATRTIALTNLGSGSLVITNLTVSPSGLYAINPATLSLLAAGTGTNVVLSMNSATNGNQPGLLRFETNDSVDDDEVENPFVLYLSTYVNPSGTPPSVSITSPSDGSSFTIPGSLLIQANASATSTSTVSQVEFVAIGPKGAASIGIDTSSPYSNSWTSATAGTNILRAIVTDTAGRRAISSPVTIVVNTTPVAKDDRLWLFASAENEAIDVLGNDIDADHDVLSVQSVGTPTNGIVVLTDGTIFYTPTNSGHDRFTYTINDGRGGSSTATVIIDLPTSPNIADPIVAITSPSTGTEITLPTAISGTVFSEFLQSYQLEYRRRSAKPGLWNTLASGEASVTNVTLATFDPTVLVNGIYELRLRGVDWLGTTTETNINIDVSGGSKVGNFTLSFTDLSIPVSGLPITVTRTYDSRDTDPGDFGAGWKLDVSSVHLEKSGIMGEGWALQSGFLSECVFDTGVEGHMITVTFPDNKVYRFVPVLELNGQGKPCTVVGGISVSEASMSFRPLPGTVGTLTQFHPPANLSVNYSSLDDSITLHEDRDDPAEDSVFGILYDPAEFIFTTLDGRQFQFNADGKVVKMTDRNGNTLVFRPDGIIHSSGKSVKFVRDGSGRITEIYDPNGLDSSGEPTGRATIYYDYDGQGNLVAVRRLTDRSLPAYVSTRFAYENSKYPHHLTRIDDPRGVTGIRNEFGDDGRLSSTTDADGKSISFVHDLNGRSETVVDRLGRTNVFRYDIKGNVTNSVDALGRTNTFVFDSNNNKTSEVIAGLHTNTFTYDGNNLLTESVVGGLITNRFSYNAAGQLLAALDGLGRGTTNFYNALGHLITTTNALGFTNGFIYDSVGNQIGSVDALGTQITNRYDQFGNLTNSVTAGLVSMVYSYDANGNREVEVQLDAASLQSVSTNIYLYDAQNRVIGTVDSFGRTNRTAFNEIGQAEEMTDKTGKATRYEYDARGNPSKVIYSDNTFEEFTHDAESNPTNRVDRAGRSTGFVYDALNRLVQTIYPDATSTRTIYDELGRVKFSVDARGVTNAFAYDAAGRLTATTNAWGSLNQWSTNAYDAAGNLVATGDANGRVTDFAYNAENQQVKVTYPAIVFGQPRHFLLTAYDAEGRRTIETNESSIVTGFQYQGSLGLLTSVTNGHATADKTVTRYSYDALGRQTNQTDALGRRTAFEFDAEGRRLRRLLPGSQSEGFGYDGESTLLRQTNFNGQVITNQYDSKNRLASHWHGSTQLVAFTYTVTGRRATMSNEAGVVSWVYDNRDRVRTNSTPAGTLYYDYDANGNLIRLWTSTASGTDVTYEYDALNRLTNAIDNRLTGTKNTTYSFDGVGNLTGLKYPNGITNQWQYDARNRLTNLVWKLNTSTNAVFVYQLEAAGYRTHLDETVNGSNRVYQWSYDNLYRLKGEIITASTPTGAVSYAYDAVGNRTSRTSTLAGILTTNNYFDANDWLDADSNTNNGSAWFDKNGNTRTNDAAVYLYDWANRLTNAVIGAMNVAIVYNGDGQRVKKTVIVGAATNVTLYLNDDLNPTGYAQVVEESTVSGGTTNLTRAYTYGLDIISQRLPGVSTNFYGYDGSGSARFLSNPGGAVTDIYAYDAFGTELASIGTTANNYRFQGEEWDADLGLAFHRARYYLPGAGRWLTMDSWEGNNAEPLSLHKYAGFHNSPLNGIDPSGHEFSLTTMLTTTAKGAMIATRVASVGYTGYDRVTWLRDGVQIVSGALATGTVNPVAAGMWVSDFIPWGRALRRAGHFIGKAGNLPGVGAHLTSVMKGIQGIGNKGKEQLGIIAAKVTARAKGLQDIGYVPRGNGGFDDVFKDKDGYFVVVESKFGLNPKLNPATASNPAQMSKEWIEKNVRNLGANNQHLAAELEKAYAEKRIRGMVVKTKVDPNGNVLDPEFEVRDWDEIGEESWIK